MKKALRIEMVYEKYPYSYPVFKLFLDFFKKKSSFDIHTTVFEKSKQIEKDNYEMPSYKKRKLLEKFYKYINSKYKTLSYPQIYWVKKETDIVHLQQSFMFSHLIKWGDLKGIKKPKIVITLRGGDTYVKPWLSSRWTEFYKNNSNEIDAFITMSQNQKEYLMRWGIESSKIHVIPTSFGEHSNANPKLPNKEVMKLVSAYRMTWEKNIEGTIQFAQQLKNKNIPFLFDIYGDGADLGQLYYLVDKYDLSNEVNIKGRVDNNFLKKELIKYDFFIQLSISDALPTSVLEAQSAGLPCVVSNTDGLKEAIIHNQTGIVSDYFDIEYLCNETINLWNDTERYYQFSKNAIEFMNNNFSLEIETERTINLYNKITNIG